MIEPGSYRRGTVLAGGEFGDRGAAYETASVAGGMTYTNPGVYGDDYLYPAAADLTYIAGRMPNAIAKLMVRMERLTTSMSGPLRNVEIPRITAVLDGAQAAGVGIILNAWNFGAVWTDNGSGTAIRQPMTPGSAAAAALADFWIRVVNQWGNHPALIGVELMTEPVSLDGGGAGWETVTQDALTAIRTASMTMPVWVPTYGWGLSDLYEHPNGPWITDPAGIYGYTGHQYAYNLGGDGLSYANTLQSAIDQGYTAGTEADALHTREIEQADNFALWLGAETGFISEYGFPSVEATEVTDADAELWAAYGDRMLWVYDYYGWWATTWTSGRVVPPSMTYVLYYPAVGWDTDIDSATSIAAIVEAHPSSIATPTDEAAGEIRIGTSNIVAIRLGAGGISRVYQGNMLIFDTNAGGVKLDATVRSVTTGSIPYNQVAKTIAKPADTAEGDMLLLIAHADYGPAADFTVPSGFSTLNKRELAAGGDKQLIGYRIAGANEPATYTLGVPLDADVRADLLAISGVDHTAIPTVAVNTTPTSATTHTAPSVTPGSDRGLLVSAMSLSAGAGAQTFAWTPPSAMTERTDAATNGYATLTTATQTWDAATATGTRTFTLATSSPGDAGMGASIVVPSGAEGGTVGGYTPTSTGGDTGTYEARNGIGFTATGTTGSISSVYNLDATSATVSTPAPLVIHLHGDGMQEYTQMAAGTAGVWQNYAKVAKAHNAIFVIPRTPDTTSETWWTLDTPRVWLAALIQDLQDRFNIDKKRIYLSGFSGGAEHITYNMVADHHALFHGGGAMILGGGGATAGLMFTGTPTAALKAHFPMHWVVGENDDGSSSTDSFHAIEAATTGEAWYDRQGFDTALHTIAGADHYESEQYGPHYLNLVINRTHTGYGLPSVSVAVPAPAATLDYIGVASLGSGGSWTDAITTNRSFTDGAGTVGRYRAFVSHVPTANRTKPIPLVIHLHGDGAWEYDNPTTWTSPLYMQVAKDIGGIGFIPEAMDLEYNLRSWWSGTRGADWVKNLILHLEGQYNIDRRQVYISGFSGGAVILAEDIIPKYHMNFAGGGAMLLGGGQPGTIVGTPHPQVLRDFPLRWHVGTADDGSTEADGYNARAAAEAGETYYETAGFDTNLTYIQGENHGESEDNGPAAFRALVNTSRAKYGLPSI